MSDSAWSRQLKSKSPCSRLLNRDPKFMLRMVVTRPDVSAVWADVNALPGLSLLSVCGICGHGSPKRPIMGGGR